ncbi:hypothetical protein FOL47_009462 [Perkinsus chesapeaki]|uniref:Uncharacterized protein n=1 Tax=Perkinsus chesapeaki TaxID=330153 RepID=A0A7J6L881_PERCH|nr:hypothetical protein FOL47_009462 [Perkinsus chesapeaki]
MDSSSSQDILLHAGDGVLYWRDLHDPTLTVLGRTHLGRGTSSRTSSSPWLAGLSMDIPNREVVVGRSTCLPGYHPHCRGSIDVFDLETQALVSSWDMPLDRGGLVALDRVINPSWIVGSTGDSAVNAWDARMGGMSMAIGGLASVPMPRTIAQRGHVVVVGTAAASATVFDVRRPNSILASNIGGVNLPCSHLSMDDCALTVWYSSDEEDFVSIYEMSPSFAPIVELMPLQRRVTAVSQPAKRSTLVDAPTMPGVRGQTVLSVLGITRPKHSGRGGMKHDLCIVADVSDHSLVDGEREIDPAVNPTPLGTRRPTPEVRMVTVTLQAALQACEALEGVFTPVSDKRDNFINH